ncbi:phosphopentomutase [bacterium BMS3Abin04]|nr:phosphopentomutase [bacterium BMS3Abin04]
MNLKSTLLIFIDGLGIGKADKKINPFFKYKFKIFTEYFNQIPSLSNRYIEKDETAFLFPTDAHLGIPGLPQSGTGQTSIFCGINAAKKIGKHFGPYPYSTLIPIIEKKNIFEEFLRLNKKVAFANAYPSIFFDYVNKGRRRLSVSTLSCILSNVKLRSSTDLRHSNAVSAEIDNEYWVKKLHYKIPIILPKTAAKRLLRLTERNHFTMFEYFHTDHLGHGRNKGDMEERLSVLDDFLFYVFTHIENDTNLIVCSDHGNLEDISVKTHTRNPALTITIGKDAKILRRKIKHLYDIKKAILGLYK